MEQEQVTEQVEEQNAAQAEAPVTDQDPPEHPLVGAFRVYDMAFDVAVREVVADMMAPVMGLIRSDIHALAIMTGVGLYALPSNRPENQVQ